MSLFAPMVMTYGRIGWWKEQIGRNLTDPVDGILNRYLVYNRSHLVHFRISIDVWRDWGEVAASESKREMLLPSAGSARLSRNAYRSGSCSVSRL